MEMLTEYLAKGFMTILSISMPGSPKYPLNFSRGIIVCQNAKYGKRRKSPNTRATRKCRPDVERKFRWLYCAAVNVTQ